MEEQELRLPPTPAEWNAMKAENARLHAENSQLTNDMGTVKQAREMTDRAMASARVWEERCVERLKERDAARAEVERLRADLQGAMATVEAEHMRAEAALLQKDVYRNAFLARYAVQLHQADCRVCLGSVVCLKGQELRTSAAIYEEQAGELEKSVGRQTEKQEKGP